MKSFSQFLEESYLNEEVPAGMTRDQFNALPAESRRRLGGGSSAALGRQGQPLQGAASAPAVRSARKSQKGSVETSATPEIKSTKVQSPARKPGDPWNQFPKKPQQQLGLPKEGPSSQVPNRILAPAGGTTPKPALPAAGSTAKGGALAKTTPSTLATTPKIEPVNVRVITPQQKALPAGKPPSGPKPSTLRTAANAADKAATVASGASKLGKLSKFAGPASAALDTALSTADERSKGSGWARSLAKGATVAAGGLLGGTAGAIGGGGLLSAATGTAGALAGGAAAEKAFDTAAGANAAQRKAMAIANRQRQSGAALKGIGGKTTFDTKKNTMTTGVGPQRKTVQLAKTSVVTGPKGKQETGYLAYKGGQAVYKRAQSPQSLAQTSSNPLERIGRSLFAGAYKKSDAAAAAQKLAQARQSDVKRQQALGVKFKPGG